MWTNKLSWSYSGGGAKNRRNRVISRFRKRIKSNGLIRTLNEFLYYVLYRCFLINGETSNVKQVINSVQCVPRKALSEIRQLYITDIKSTEVLEAIQSSNLDVIFSMCIDVYLPGNIINAPKHGAFLWHEGITPEYRGVYSPFWALLNRDYERLGYTLLKMNAKLDAGDIYVQGTAEGIDMRKHWHSYIGHKAVLDSLPHVKEFLQQLELGEAKRIQRTGARDCYYSYPTGTALLRLLLRKFLSGSL